MCGLAGILATAASARAPTRAELLRMAFAMRHRGPDELGVFHEGRVGLAHARLSVIDVAGGRQPMPAPDGAAWIVYNGEAFDHVELRAALEARGHAFRTASDTEVVLAAWREWGEDGLRRIDGQYALAIWEPERERLVLARDRFGVLPLYTCAHAGRVFFASEVKGIFAASGDIPRGFDPRGLDETFTFWTVVPPRTVFAGVEELPPGHIRTYDLRRGTVEEHAYDAVSFGARAAPRRTLAEATAAVEASLDHAVRLRMTRADVPVGAYLSGGLDSALVAALAQRACGQFATFSLRFEDAEYDETRYQRLVASALGTEHHEIVATRDDIAAVFPAVVTHAERPILRTAPAPLFLLSRLVREAGVKVVVTGEGADELFAGYDLFREGRIRRFWARQPGSTTRPLLLARLYPYLARSPVAQRAFAERFFGRGLAGAGRVGFAHGPRWASTSAVKRLFSRALRAELNGADSAGELLASIPPEVASWSPLAQDQWLEIKTLLSGYLLSAQGDRMLMAHSVEGRFPFLDRHVVDLACSLPDDAKLKVLDEKHVLKRVARGLVPDAVRARAKQPYRAPDALALTTRAALGWAERALSPRAVADAGVFDEGAVARLWAKCRAQAAAGQLSNTDNMALVGVLSTQLLHASLIVGAGAADAPARPASRPSPSLATFKVQP